MSEVNKTGVRKIHLYWIIDDKYPVNLKNTDKKFYIAPPQCTECGHTWRTRTRFIVFGEMIFCVDCLSERLKGEARGKKERDE